MKIMHCPLNGPRNISEFVWGGDVRRAVDPATCSDAEWAEHLFLEDNIAGEVDEWWLHAPSNSWLIARRNTITDEVLWTMPVDRYFAGRERGGHDDVQPAAAQTTGGEA